MSDSGRDKYIERMKAQREREKYRNLIMGRHNQSRLVSSNKYFAPISNAYQENMDLSRSAAEIFKKHDSHPASAKILDISMSTGFKPSRLVLFEGYDKDGRHMPDLTKQVLKYESELDNIIYNDLDKLLNDEHIQFRPPSPPLLNRSLMGGLLKADTTSNSQFKSLEHNFFKSQKSDLDYYLCCLPGKTDDYDPKALLKANIPKSDRQAKSALKSAKQGVNRKLDQINEEVSVISSINYSRIDPRVKSGVSLSDVENFRQILPMSAKNNPRKRNDRAESKFSSKWSASPSQVGRKSPHLEKSKIKFDEMERKINEEIYDIDDELEEMKEDLEEKKRICALAAKKAQVPYNPTFQSSSLISNQYPHISNQRQNHIELPKETLEDPSHLNPTATPNAVTPAHKIHQPEAAVSEPEARRQPASEGQFRVTNMGSKSSLLGYRQRHKMQMINKITDDGSLSHLGFKSHPRVQKSQEIMRGKARGDVIVHQSSGGIMKVSQGFDIRHLTSQ